MSGKGGAIALPIALKHAYTPCPICVEGLAKRLPQQQRYN